ncbi:MAG: flagellar biosynthetic protein FliO [Ignavibacteriaceae bacterium]|nr:flagellar biosynthetic protein FliO [Ignavibacteriaceae bacterium]
MGFLDVLKALFPLVLVIGLLYAVLIFIKRKGITVTGKRSKIFNIDVLSTQSIMPKKYISVVKVENKYLVLGISEHSINLLKELDIDENQIDEEVDNDTIKNNFLDTLKKNFGMK